ncbi:MAG TPA: periplasmic heavy metal sensor [Verrucomicrobiae bacterium]|jgi:Spy/CpxP family protein refolding chaperone
MKRIIIFTVMVGWVTVASAQNHGDRQNAGGRFFPGLAQVLTDTQRASLQTALQSEYSQIKPLEQKMRTSRQALLDEIANGNFNEAAAQQDAQSSAQAEAELTVIYARALSQMTPSLSAAQIGQMKSFQPGQFQRGGAEATPSSPPESHLPLPPTLPQDSNGLPVVN